MAAKAFTAGLVLEQLNGQNVLRRLLLLCALFIVALAIDRTDAKILAITVICAALCLIVHLQLQHLK